jgi:hypothetical protein
MEMKKIVAEKKSEKLTPQLYLELDNQSTLEVNSKKAINNFLGKDEWGFSHYSYDGIVTNKAKHTGYRDIHICFEFKDKEDNVLDELCYKIREVVNLGEVQKFHIDIEAPKNQDDIAKFQVTIKNAEALRKKKINVITSIIKT